MLVPTRILGGILAATLGLSWGLAARSEPPPPSGFILPDTAPDAGTGALSRVAGPDVQPHGPDDAILRPRARPLPAVTLLRPMAREDILPDARWDGRGDAESWTRATLAAINGGRNDLSEVVPRDIMLWCPAYADNPERLRDAFWVGMMSALARHESRLDPSAVGGGGLYHGLLQIYPATAQSYGCAVTTGQGLHDPEDNLACAARIITANVMRDDVVALYDGRWRGVAAEWGPMTDSDKRAEMSAWTRAQDYCTLSTVVFAAPIPPTRPWTLSEANAHLPLAEAIEIAMMTTAQGSLDRLR